MGGDIYPCWSRVSTVTIDWWSQLNSLIFHSQISSSVISGCLVLKVWQEWQKIVSSPLLSLPKMTSCLSGEDVIVTSDLDV